jgi:hypothetical protein
MTLTNICNRYEFDIVGMLKLYSPKPARTAAREVEEKVGTKKE